MQNIVTNKLIDAGIAPDIKGFNHLRTAVILVLESPNLIFEITKVLYPLIAKAHNSTPSKVERTIRHAIEIIFDKCEPEYLQEMFGRVPSNARGRPTNSQFISLFAERIRMELDGKSA